LPGRLECIVVPAPRSPANGYYQKIDRTDELIYEIVYELYGLTDEEIEIVEDAVQVRTGNEGPEAV